VARALKGGNPDAAKSRKNRAAGRRNELGAHGRTPAEATSKHLTILASVPDLAFPFFVYMMGQIKDEANRLGDITVIESDGQRSSPKQSADLEAAIAEGVDGIVINPNDFDALAPALQEAIDSKIPAVTIDRRANVRGILAHVCANDDMALGALVALKSRNLVGKVALVGFDALPEALGEVKVGNLTATIEPKPGGQSRRAVDILVALLRDGEKPTEQVTQLVPVAITTDNVGKAERIGEVK
jgi:ABC-type sugar transport system substrate-binding protein